ncbi:MAG: Co2+/Mg2+ efflux protein ApaG [Gammaproteobacteria bacterium]|nr:Co2+/Mg2+ efflux protein ApaG [Gammaproteobacteria bacterium]
MTTNSHIDVSVETHFLWHESDPADLRYVFAYTITIENRGYSRSRLLNRHWLITNGDGYQETVDGPGVIGKKPTLMPGDTFEYTSGTILETSFGTMEGHYEFEDDLGKRFKVPIPPFILSVPDHVEH